MFLRRLKSRKDNIDNVFRTDDTFVFEKSGRKSYGYMIQGNQTSLQAADIVEAMGTFEGAFLTVAYLDDESDVSQV